MRNLTKILIGIFCIPMFLFAQDGEEPKYRMSELIYIKVKMGMEPKFIEAVKGHNAKYHNEEPYESSLFMISSGMESGWFVWAMGTMTFSDMDGAPGEGAHMDDWRKNVDPFVKEYGRTEYWRLNEKLSYSDGDSEPLQLLWFLDIERGEFYRFRAFMEKVAKIHTDKKEEIHVWMSQFYQPDGRDVAISWPMDKWADMDNEEWKMKDEFNKEYGEGAWDDALEEWKDVVDMTSQEIWRQVL